jgi:nucleoside-diphosphate-sugar epimerase
MGWEVCGCSARAAHILIKVLVTGGSGFIGQHCLKQLYAKGYEVHAVSSIPKPNSDLVQWHQASLLDVGQTRGLIHAVKPSHLLHLAWYTTPGKYWTAPENLDWVKGSLALMREFSEAGGKRLVTAGTCAEYEWSHGLCIEGQTPLIPATLYGTYKHAMQLMQHAWCAQNGLSGAWGRVFSLYGPAEYPDRLVASVIRALLRSEVATCGNGTLVRDYSHAEDVASAFVSILESSIEGPVNIGSGDSVRLHDLVEKIAVKLDGSRLIRYRPPSLVPSNEPALLLPDVSRLLTTGWSKKFNLDDGLDDTIAWWRQADAR